MRVLCSLDNVEWDVPECALSRSLLLADMQSVDSKALVKLPCDSGTWVAWLVWVTDDTAMIDDVEVVIAVFQVR
jgi:hypothetical protein